MRISKFGLDPVIFFFTSSILVKTISCQLAQKLVTFCFAILLYFNFSKSMKKMQTVLKIQDPCSKYRKIDQKTKIAKIQEIQDHWDLCLCILPNYADSNFYKSIYRKNLHENSQYSDFRYFFSLYKILQILLQKNFQLLGCFLYPHILGCWWRLL